MMPLPPLRFRAACAHDDAISPLRDIYCWLPMSYITFSLCRCRHAADYFAIISLSLADAITDILIALFTSPLCCL